MPMKPEDVKMPFGQHAGKTMRQILQDAPAYLDWLAGITITNEVLEEAVRYMNATYAAEIERALDR